MPGCRAAVALERDLAGLLRAAGFARVDTEPYRLHTPFNTHIAGVAFAATSAECSRAA
ncbi:hypothetical protein Aau02nite_69460 [Amorphoplanes auranticolor]|uniref:Uncharacterized protein n=1 Tax=Actinoplanes auranticolor TaxID=47988 RepID=A0A919SNL0_9ACTN|nr:hypothetical protein Aau02nite_69460 [Actinoplanes auranticolor]